MPALPEAVGALIAALERLPGIGPRSAERIALHLVQSEPGAARALAESIIAARERVQACQECGGLTDRQPCALCDDPRRDSSVLCLVEGPVDILNLEKSGAFHGRYHVLGGRISPINGIGPEDLRLESLERRLARGEIRELILALGTDVEGDATSYYLAKRLARPGLEITRIAHGLPVGAGLEFADELTLSRALEGRRQIR